MIGTPTTRTRVLSRLVTARANKQWMSRRDIIRMGVSAHYTDIVLSRLLKEGLIERKGPRGKYLYRASKTAQTYLELGQLPRSRQKRLKASERPRGHLVQLQPISNIMDVDELWMEAQRVVVQLDAYTAQVLRTKCNAPSRRDKAEQRSFGTRFFTITISKKGAANLMLKEPTWPKALAQWFMACGISQAGTNSIMSMIFAQLPDSFKRMEMPVLDRTPKRQEVQFVVSTRVGDDKIVSNINYSTNIDWEIFGKGYLVDQYLSVLAGTQHNQVVAMVALEQKIMQLSRQVEEMRKEKEKEKKEQESKDKGGQDYIG